MRNLVKFYAIMATATPFIPTTLLSVAGSGIKTTQSFNAPSAWALGWQYDCSAFGSRGNFIVTVFNSNGTMSRNAGVNQLGLSGNSIEYFHQGGPMYLEMNSECNWNVSAIG